MAELFLSIALFLALHSAPRATGLRDVAIERIGRGPYLALYSAASLASLAWTISAALRAPYVPLWPPSAVGHWIAVVAMAPAVWLWTSGLARPNDLSIAFRGGHAAPGGALLWTRHPVLWGFALWGLAHFIANGDLASAVLFGGSALFAVVGMRIMDARARRRLGDDAWAAAARRPALAERLLGMARPRALVEAAIAILVYLGLAYAHPPILGVSPFALL